jgi:hypothetical protein
MPKKGKKTPRKPKIRKTFPPEPSIPPPDDPALRGEGESLGEQSKAQREQAAKLRLKALEQARKMPMPDKQGIENKPGESDEREEECHVNEEQHTESSKQ